MLCRIEPALQPPLLTVGGRQPSRFHQRVHIACWKSLWAVYNVLLEKYLTKRRCLPFLVQRLRGIGPVCSWSEHLLNFLLTNNNRSESLPLTLVPFFLCEVKLRIQFPAVHSIIYVQITSICFPSVFSVVIQKSSFIPLILDTLFTYVQCRITWCYNLCEWILIVVGNFLSAVIIPDVESLSDTFYKWQ